MFGISGTELALILFFGFLIFGPDKLPQIGRTIGQAIRQFRETSEEMNKKFKDEIYDPFQEAVAPIKEDINKKIEPYKEDISSIKGTFDETKSMITQPFQEVKDQTEEMKKSIDPFADNTTSPNADDVIRDQAGRLPKKELKTIDEVNESANAAQQSDTSAASNKDENKASSTNTAKKDSSKAKSDSNKAASSNKASSNKASSNKVSTNKNAASKSSAKEQQQKTKKTVPLADAETSKKSESKQTKNKKDGGKQAKKQTVAASLYGIDSKGGE